MTDPVNPRHYKDHPSGVECVDVVEWLPFNIGNAAKYIWRAGLKDDPRTDLAKAAWYLRRALVCPYVEVRVVPGDLRATVACVVQADVGLLARVLPLLTGELGDRKENIVAALDVVEAEIARLA